jgi:hypothetical protein
MISYCSRHCPVGKCTYLRAESSCTDTTHNTTTDSNTIVDHSLRLTLLSRSYSFIHRNEENLIAKWTSGMDRNRYEADSGWKYKRYFNLLHSTIDKYNILPENTYNIDKKGFIIGLIEKSKRVFSRQMWEKG